MPQVSKTGIILLRDGAVLPPSFAVESEAFLPGWRVVKHFARYRPEEWLAITSPGKRRFCWCKAGNESDFLF
jgi:hypothetical protein